MVDWSRLVDRGWMVNGGGFVCGSMVAWSMGDSMTVSGRMAMLNSSMAVDITIGYCQEGNKSDEKL